MSRALSFPPSLQPEGSKFVVFVLPGLVFYNVLICKQQEIPLKLL